jgi:trigger factor
MYAKTETVERPIQKGDFVMIDMKGMKENASPDEPPLIDRPNLPVFVRPDEKPDEFPFKGFSNELVGVNVNESKTFTHKFDDKAKEPTLISQTVQFTVTVKMVRGSILPELNDEFAKQVGPFETLQALKDAIKANLATQSKAAFDDDYFSKLMEKIKEGATISYPPQVVDHEVEHVMEDLKTRLASQNLDLAAYLKSRQMDEEKFIAEEARPIGIKRLERALIMDEIAKAEKIEISKDELQSSFQKTWGEYESDPSFQKQLKGKSQPPKQLLDAVAMESANRAFVQLTLNRLKEIATGQAPALEKAEEGAEDKEEKKPTAKKAPSSKTTAARAKKPVSAEKTAASAKKTAPKGKTGKTTSTKK